MSSRITQALALTGCLSAVAFALAAPRAAGASGAQLTRASLSALLHEHAVPGATVAVVQDGVVEVLAAGETADGAAMTPARVLPAASLSKPVAALGVLVLVEDGVLELDRPIARYLAPEDTPPRLPDEVTVRTLLSHTSGLPNLARGAALRPAFEPGSRWRYSGEGYRLLQAAVERQTGMSLEAFLQERVLVPLGLRSSTFLAREPAPGAPGADAAGSLRTTAGDYGRFLASVLEASGGATPARRMLTEQIVADPDLQLAWSLGWALWRGDEEVFFHWGSSPGFEAFALGVPGRRRGVVLLTNSNDGLELADEVVELAMGRTYPFFSFYMLHPDD